MSSVNINASNSSSHRFNDLGDSIKKRIVSFSDPKTLDNVKCASKELKQLFNEQILSAGLEHQITGTKNLATRAMTTRELRIINNAHAANPYLSSLDCMNLLAVIEGMGK